jgi:hypothetical protein
MSDPTQNRPRSSPSRPSPATPRHVFSPDHDATAKRATLAAVRAALETAGLDVEHLDEQRRQSRARLEAALDRFRAESDERASAMQDAVARSAENWLEAHRVTTALAPATGVYSVSTADSISADPGLDLRAENIGPWANTTEVVFSERTSDVSFFDGRVSFALLLAEPDRAGRAVYRHRTIRRRRHRRRDGRQLLVAARPDAPCQQNRRHRRARA